MDTSYEKKYHDLEQNHWWFVGRRDLIKRMVSATPKTAKILEVGCSGGILLKELSELGYSRVHGIDISPDAVATAAERGIKNVICADACFLPFSDNTFDMVIASDILEHIKDYSSALKEWHRVLSPGGVLIVFVPAFKILWSGHDDASHHFERYTKKELKKRLINVGFKPLVSTYWNTALFLPIAAIRICARVLPFKSLHKKDQLFPPPQIINFLLVNLLRIENALIKLGIHFPFGISVGAVAKKYDSNV